MPKTRAGKVSRVLQIHQCYHVYNRGNNGETLSRFGLDTTGVGICSAVPSIDFMEPIARAALFSQPE